ncbi:NepR family anti-sigma factor [Pseudochrobactrum sp. sp1633]|nr:NepR family anti-sigma factor [Pseudochrobactrum sp. sp1633]MDM8345660.1 NepR family anti-sigma factor [Pseudochrobactrum sp. sp1633]HWD12363.1 NepR family anti-sigma factor [Pseudochrobactrum sp.]
MTSLPRDQYAQNSPRSGGLNKGDELGPNTEIGSKLRALYSSIQDETIPDRFLDLLEKLDQAERQSASRSRN